MVCELRRKNVPNLTIFYKVNESFSQEEGAKKYHDNDALSKVTAYSTQYQKTANQFIDGIGVNPRQAAMEMELLSRAYGKFSRLRLRHFQLSFSDEETRKLKRYCGSLQGVYDELDQIGWYAASYYGGQYQIIYAVHQDTSHPHIHFVMNVVHCNTGAKYRGDKADYYRFRNYLGKFLMETYGFQPVKLSR